MKKNRILDVAIQHFEALTSLKMKVSERINKSVEPDLIMNITDPQTKKEVMIIVEMKNEIRNNDIPKLLANNKEYKNFIVLAQYISKPNRELLRKNQINYLESSGNCFIQKSPIFILIDNQKVQAQRQTANSKLLTENGMRFVYAVFLNPVLIEASYRQISAEAEIALGSVGAIIDELEKQNFISIKNDKRVLKNKAELFELWANNFVNTMRPHLLQRRLSFADKTAVLNWKNIELKNAFWGGEPAANLLDRYLVPEQFVIYSNDNLHQLMKKYKLIPDEKGNVIYMLLPFTHKQMPEIADPFIIYAELIQSNDSRCLEAAQRIKEKYIDPKL